ncbi:MFS transporter [Kitasatospora sp. NPDC058965]|uniref:MFS transporter n=1 Tax=Kitasatospora sp. NPDC058965 TaxID=3346682 RepID=UPI0036AEEF30
MNARAVRRDVTLYWWGQTTSAFGSVFTAIAVPVIAVVALHASAGEIGLVSAASSLPVLLFGLPLGALADRITRPRRVLTALDVVCALVVALLARGLATGTVGIGALAAGAVLLGGVGSLESAVYFVHLRQLVGVEGVGRARARLQAGSYGAALLGRVLAGPTIVLVGGAGALAADAVSYLLSASALLAMRSPDLVPRESGTGALDALRGAAAGLRFFARPGFPRALLVFVVVPATTMAAVTALTGPFLLRVVHLPTGAYGLVFAFSGLMGLVGSLVSGRVLGPTRNPRLVVLAAFAVAMVCVLLLPLAAGPLPLAAGCAALGIGLPIFFGAIANVGLSATLAADVPEDTLGRAMAALQMVVAAAGLVGAVGGGALGDALGVRPALWALGGSALAAVAVSLPPAVRAARRRGRPAVPHGPVPAPARTAG